MITSPAAPTRSPYILIVILIILLGVGAYFLFTRPKDASTTNNASGSATANENSNEPSFAITREVNADTNATGSQTYTDDEFGFSVDVPASWAVDKGETGEADARIVNFVFATEVGDQGVSLIIVNDALEGIVRESFSVTNETKVEINGQEATRLTGSQENNGETLGLLFFRQDATLYILNGLPEDVDAVGQSFRFTN